jgi:subtilisin family serine protease
LLHFVKPPSLPLLTGTLLVAVFAVAFGQPAAGGRASTSTTPAATSAGSAQETALVYIVMEGDPVAAFAPRGGAIQKSGITLAATRARAAEIATQQAVLKTSITRAGARVMGSYSRLANVVKARVPVAALPQLAAMPGVVRVEPVRLYERATTSSVPFVGASKVWGPHTGNADGSGVRIGIIDTGIDYTHADFGGSGDTADYNSNDPTRIEPGTFPTPKVVGGFDFAGNSYNPASPDPAEYTPFSDPDPLDCNGHGSHVAGIAAGFGVLTNGLTFKGPYSSELKAGDFRIGPGVAPNAKLYALKIFGCDGPTDLVLDALEWAADPNGDFDFSDHLDVVNLSLGSSFGIVSPDDVELNSANHLSAIGCAVVVAAGNSGNLFYTISTPGVAERAISVGSSVGAGLAQSAIEVLSPSAIRGLFESVEGSFTVPLSVTGPLTNTVVYAQPVKACDDLTNAAQLKGKIALIDRGTCFFTEKIKRAQDAGAVAVIMVNNVAGPPIVMGGTDDTIAIPGVMISQADGDILKSSLRSNPRVRLDAGLILPGSERADQLADSSSRGPSSPGSVLKPEIVAPGESIYSAAVGTGTNGVTYSGTSMAAPHVSGAAALLKQLHRDWTAEQIKAALMNSAAPTHDEKGVAYPESRTGAGRLRIDQAAALPATAIAEDGEGTVSVSFGALDITDSFSRTRHVRLTNHTSDPIHFDLSIIPTVTEAGAGVKLLADKVELPPRSSLSIPVELGVDPRQLDRKGDATTPARSNGLARQMLYEVSGRIHFESTNASIDLPYYAVVRAGSEFSVTAANIGVPGGSNTVNFAIPVHGTSAHPLPVSSVFQLGAASPLKKLGDPIFAAADLLAVGVATDKATQGSVDNSTLYFGIATAGSWTTPQDFLVDLEVLIDVNHDGIIDYALINSSDGALTAGSFGNPNVANDVFLTVVRDVFTGDLLQGGYLNVYPANQRDTAPFNNSVLVLSAPASLLGLSDANSKINYKVISRGPDGGSLVDQTGWIGFDAARPAVDTAAFGLEGYPMRIDGRPIRVRVDRAAAVAGGFSAADPLSVLVLHHFNAFDHRFEIVRLDLETDDTDGDGLADAWELDHFGDLSTANATSDQDGDGFTDLMELRAGTDPLDPASLLRLTSATNMTGDAVTVEWSSVAGRSYSLERAPVPEAAAFAPVAEHVKATPPSNTLIDTHAPGSGPWYYRIRLE